MDKENQTNNRVSRIEEFLLDPEKTLFELLEEFGGSVEEIKNALSQIDVANLETLKGEDGKTPERGVDYFTDEDLDNIEAFILDRIPVVGEDVPSAKQVNEYIDKQVAKIPRVKGDKGNPGTPGKPGKDGSPDSALDIIKKLRSLDKNQGLQLNDIRGLVKKINLLNEVSEEFAQLKEDLSKIKILTSGAGSDGAGAVASVNGKTGTVVLTQDDIGDGVNYVRTENNFTDALLSKLTGIPTSYAFTGLTDTPASYAGQAGKFVKVNATADGLEFASVSGGGDMLASVYDPTSVNGDAFDMDNMVEGSVNKLVSASEKSDWSGKQDALGFTPENVANKKTTITSSDTDYPTCKAVDTELNAKAPAASPIFTGTVTLADNARIDLTLPTADTYVTGNTTDSFAAGYSSAIGDLVFFGSGGKWLEVDADAVATCKGLIGIALEDKNDTEIMKVALPGSFVRLDSWNWTVGATLYAGETLGAIQETIPTGADAVIKVVGFAVSTDVIYFNPSPDQQTTVA